MQFFSHAWYWIIALLVATAYAGGLYFKNKRDELATGWRISLACLRFGFVFLVCLLLFAPLVKLKRERIEKPLCFLLLDQSASMPPGIDTVLLKRNLRSFSEKISPNFDVREVGFGLSSRTGFDFAFDQPATDFGKAFEHAGRLAAGNENAVCILFSDGNGNTGKEAVSAYRTLALPLYTVGMGDTAVYPDLFVAQTIVNDYAYKGNRFPLQARLGQSEAPDAVARLVLEREGKPLRDTLVSFRGKKEQTVEWNIEAEECGLFRYSIALEPLANERNVRNNRHSFFVRVLENRQKILILAHSPHPDLSCLRQSLQRQEKYQVDLVLAKDLEYLDRLETQMDAYDLIILHGLPSGLYPLHRIKTALGKKPLFYLLTASTDLSALSNEGVRLRLRANRWNETQANLDPGFGLFNVSAQEKEIWQGFPPLQAPFAQYETVAGGQAIFTQTVLGVPTTDPLLWIGPRNDRRIAVCFGTHLWKWRLAAFLEKGETGPFDLLMDKCIQLLCMAKPEQNLVVQCPSMLPATEPLSVRARLYNASFETVSQAEIRFKLTEQGSKTEYLFDFVPEEDRYVLNAGFLPEGSYVYSAQARTGAETYQADGRLVVADPQMENPMQRADLALLRNLALTYQGRFFYMGADGNGNRDVWDRLAEELQGRKDLKPRIKTEESHVSPLDRTWLLVLLLALAGFEYLARKRFGDL